MNPRLGIIGVLVLVIIILAANLVWRNARQNALAVANFTECVQAGFPVLESYPRQCRDNAGTLHTEVLTVIEPQVVVPTLSEADARRIAESAELCTDRGTVLDFERFDTATGIWWYTMSTVLAGCTPGCAVNDSSKTAALELRCES